jgi:hypothetical protein
VTLPWPNSHQIQTPLGALRTQAGREHLLHHWVQVSTTLKQRKNEFLFQTLFKGVVNIGTWTGAKAELLLVHQAHRFMTVTIELLVNFAVVLHTVLTI